jgi:hypothetical protein
VATKAVETLPQLWVAWGGGRGRRGGVASAKTEEAAKGALGAIEVKH